VSNPFDFQRFVDAQAGGFYETAPRELKASRKRGHWIVLSCSGSCWANDAG
jgi:uncharacterized protein (DUF1810 family)